MRKILASILILGLLPGCPHPGNGGPKDPLLPPVEKPIPPDPGPKPTPPEKPTPSPDPKPPKAPTPTPQPPDDGNPT